MKEFYYGTIYRMYPQIIEMVQLRSRWGSQTKSEIVANLLEALRG